MLSTGTTLSQWKMRWELIWWFSALKSSYQHDTERMWCFYGQYCKQLWQWKSTNAKISQDSLCRDQRKSSYTCPSHREDSHKCTKNCLRTLSLPWPQWFLNQHKLSTVEQWSSTLLPLQWLDHETPQPCSNSGKSKK